MPRLFTLVGATVAASAVASEVTPIEKVITLLEDMKSGVEQDGRNEAKVYDEFSCFCRDTTKTKSDSVIRENDNIDRLSANIADKTQSKADDTTELAKRKKDGEKMAADLAESTANWEKRLSEYQVQSADFSKAISSLKGAIKSMKDTGGGASLLSVKQGLSKTLALADAMQMVTSPEHKAAASFLQAAVDPNDPEYEYHSNDIVKLCESLLKDFSENKKDLDDEHEKAKKAYEEFQRSTTKKKEANKRAMEALDKSIARLSKQIAQDRGDLVTSQGILSDDELYLKDLTARCEARANDFDQRSSMRNDEITAISTALKVLKDEVQPADKANQRALFIQKAMKAQAAVEAQPVQKALPTKETQRAVSLLQEAASSNLRGGSSVEARKAHALAMLKGEGNRLNSLALTSLAAQSSADPFKKVKGLIQKLIERLLAESAAEATKKGFCDTELGKARKERDFRFSEANDLSADLAQLEAKQDALTAEIKTLGQNIKDETAALKHATEDRADEKAENMETLKTAKGGLEAVTEALQVLRSFYKQAAKAAFILASPVDEDTAGAGFSGNYKGNQSGSNAVLSLLETIQSDFDRTIRTTEADEEAAHREFVDFSQHSKSSIAAKTTKKTLSEEDLATTKTNIETKMQGLNSAMDLLDSALKELEELKPTCIDTGMSYSERVKKREEEMKALKNALCILDGDNVEPECNAKL